MYSESDADLLYTGWVLCWLPSYGGKSPLTTDTKALECMSLDVPLLNPIDPFSWFSTNAHAYSTLSEIGIDIPPDFRKYCFYVFTVCHIRIGTENRTVQTRQYGVGSFRLLVIVLSPTERKKSMTDEKCAALWFFVVCPPESSTDSIVSSIQHLWL